MLNLNRHKDIPKFTPPSPIEAQETNRINSRKVLIEIWTNEKADYRDYRNDLKNLGYKIPSSIFVASSLIIAAIAGISDRYDDKDILQLIGMGVSYTSGFVLAIISLLTSIIVTKWGYRYFQHRQNSIENKMILGEDYCQARFKEDPPEGLWGLAVILAFAMWYLITQCILLIPAMIEG